MPSTRRTHTLSRAEVADKVAAIVGSSPTVARRHLEAAIVAIRDAVAAGHRVELRGFAVFERRKRKGGVRQNVAARNPRIIALREAASLPPLPTTVVMPAKWVAVARCTMRMPAAKKAA